MKKQTEENREFLTTFFPTGWEEKATEFKVLTRKRKIRSPDDLLRLLLIHPADGCSAREAAARAKRGGLVDISDVALIRKLRVSSEWLRWMAVQLLERRGINIKPPDWLSSYSVKSAYKFRS